MPNCEPQSPRWLSRITRCPSAAMIRARLSPMTVERRCPTCIGLATFGDEKSMTTVLTCAGGSSPSALVGQRALATSRRPRRRARRTLRNPGPATSGGPATGARSTAPRDFRRQVARLAPERLGQRHAAIGLIIAELGIGRRAHRLLEGGPVRPLGQGGTEDLPQRLEYIHDPRSGFQRFQMPGSQSQRCRIGAGSSRLSASGRR